MTAKGVLRGRVVPERMCVARWHGVFGRRLASSGIEVSGALLRVGVQMLADLVIFPDA